MLVNNELIKQRNWWKRNWKWCGLVIGVILITTYIFFLSGMNAVSTDLVQAYADEGLYENALEIVKTDRRVFALLGELEPIDKLAILEGEVKYFNNNSVVKSSIRIIGSKGKGILDISANRLNTIWNYNIITVRIKTPSHNKQIIEIFIKRSNCLGYLMVHSY